ncbi:MAG: hypothetical protein ACRCZJ_04540 [Erysipelotrichaceae bacterium]
MKLFIYNCFILLLSILICIAVYFILKKRISQFNNDQHGEYLSTQFLTILALLFFLANSEAYITSTIYLVIALITLGIALPFGIRYRAHLKYGIISIVFSTFIVSACAIILYAAF